MSKIRLNTELRNKMFNKIKNVFENENTQEREAYLTSKRKC
jgi:NADH:ubiquinone oxidoreductase subunit C